MRGVKQAAVLVTLLLAAFGWFWLSRPRTAFDVAVGYHVLETEYVTGTENTFTYKIPALGREFTAYYHTMSRTNVLWILYERPGATTNTLRWNYTNTAGVRISEEPTAAWFDKGQLHPGNRIAFQAVPVPVPDRETIQERVVCFEDPKTGASLFKVKIP